MIDSRRGFWLTVILLIFIFGQPLSFAFYCRYWYELAALGEPVSFIDILTTIAIASAALVALGGVWYWKRWGVYSVVLIIMINLVSDLLAGLPLSSLFIRLGILEYQSGTDITFLPGPPVVLGMVVTLLITIYKRWNWFH